MFTDIWKYLWLSFSIPIWIITNHSLFYPIIEGFHLSPHHPDQLDLYDISITSVMFDMNWSVVLGLAFPQGRKLLPINLLILITNKILYAVIEPFFKITQTIPL